MPSTYQQINTDPGKTVLLVQPQTWMMVSVSCDTVGPALVGSSPDMKPGTGQGVLLSMTPRELYLEPGDALYVYSDSTDRVSIAMHPVSWIPRILQVLAAMAGQPAPTTSVKGVELNYPKVPPMPTVKPLAPAAFPGGPKKVR